MYAASVIEKSSLRIPFESNVTFLSNGSSNKIPRVAMKESWNPISNTMYGLIKINKNPVIASPHNAYVCLPRNNAKYLKWPPNQLQKL